MSGIRELERNIDALMEEMGIEEYALEKSKNHPRLRVCLGGTTLTYFMAGTGSDHRTWQNTRAGIRRLLRPRMDSSSRSI